MSIWGSLPTEITAATNHELWHDGPVPDDARVDVATAWGEHGIRLASWLDDWKPGDERNRKLGEMFFTPEMAFRLGTALLRASHPMLPPNPDGPAKRDVNQ